MPKRTRPDSGVTPPSPTGNPDGHAEPMFPQPKVILVDLPQGSEAPARNAGFNVKPGTLGEPYRIDRAAGFHPVTNRSKLPGLPEQEIVFVDLVPPTVADEAPELDKPPYGEKAFWAPLARGVVDPRPLAILASRDDLQRIYRHGGILIVFAGKRVDGEYVFAERARHGGLDYPRDMPSTNWDLVDELERFSVNSDTGEEVYLEGTVCPPALRTHLEKARFTCTFSPPSYLDDRWITFATNKYDDPVAGVLVPGSDDETSGFIFVLPRVQECGAVVEALLKQTLPNLQPRLFPHFEGARWTRRPEYELPAVVEIEKEIDAANAEARERVRALQQQIEQLRKERGFLSEILTATGSDLVSAVAQTLRFLGFKEVVDVDNAEETDMAKVSRDLREDLQIRDRSPTVLVEVKGVGGRASENEALQVGKYVAPRMKEWKTHDIRALSIINTERHLPALDRDHSHAFTDDAVTSSEAQDIGLLTTWDLYRLARNYDRLGWSSEYVRELFYRSGRIPAVPAHYDYVGKVSNYFEKVQAVAIEVTNAEVVVGDVLAFETPVDFLEEKVESLELDNDPVEKATAGEEVGSKTKLGKAEIRNGMRVFRAQPSRRSIEG